MVEAGAIDFSAATMVCEHDFLSSEVSATFLTEVTKYLACSHLREKWFVVAYSLSSYHPSRQHGGREGGHDSSNRRPADHTASTVRMQRSEQQGGPDYKTSRPTPQ